MTTIEAVDLDSRHTPPPEIPTQALYDLLRSLGYDRDTAWAVVQHAKAFNTVEACALFRSEHHRDACEAVLPIDPEFGRYDNEVWGLTPFSVSLFAGAMR